MSEWLKEPVLKTGGAQVPVGSNPTLSAKLLKRHRDMRKYPSGRRGSPAKGVGWIKPARGFKSLLPRQATKPLVSGQSLSYQGFRCSYTVHCRAAEKILPLGVLTCFKPGLNPPFIFLAAVQERPCQARTGGNVPETPFSALGHIRRGLLPSWYTGFAFCTRSFFLSMPVPVRPERLRCYSAGAVFMLFSQQNGCV